MATDELHVNQVKFVLEGTRSISCTALLQKSESRQQVFTVSSPTAWGKEKFVQSGFHTCSTMTRAIHVLLANTHLQRLRNEGNAFLNHILTVDESWMHSFDPQLKQQNAKWHVPMSPRKKIARRSLGALSCLQPKWACA
jgi:hypothetical protein